MRYFVYLIIIVCGAIFFANKTNAHEMVPTYPKLVPSYMGENLVTTTMTMFNKRQEVEYYEFSVFTEDWQSIPFVSKYKIWKIPYLSTVSVEIFMNKKAAKDAVYICSRSKLRKVDLTRTAVSSRICSKIIKK